MYMANAMMMITSTGALCDISIASYRIGGNVDSGGKSDESEGLCSMAGHRSADDAALELGIV
jgi:hypothetical protein